MILPGDGRHQRGGLHVLAQAARARTAPSPISSLGIAFVGFLTWGHHMFVAGHVASFDAGVFGVALDVRGHLLGHQGLHLGRARSSAGRSRFNTPMLYFFWFLFLFVFGGMTGVAVATQSLDVHWHDTYFVVAHFHFIMVGGTLTAFLAAAPLLVPEDVGRLYSERVGLFASAAGVHRLRPHVLAAVPARQRRHAAALLQLSAAASSGSTCSRPAALAARRRRCCSRSCYLLVALSWGPRAPGRTPGARAASSG